MSPPFPFIPPPSTRNPRLNPSRTPPPKLLCQHFSLPQQHPCIHMPLHDHYLSPFQNFQLCQFSPPQHHFTSPRFPSPNFTLPTFLFHTIYTPTMFLPPPPFQLSIFLIPIFLPKILNPCTTVCNFR